MKMTIGRIVHMRLSGYMADKINDDRANDTFGSRPIGNRAKEGDTFPMIVVVVHSEEIVNGQVFLDGAETLWVTSAAEGDELGQWSWPPRAKPVPEKTGRSSEKLAEMVEPGAGVDPA